MRRATKYLNNRRGSLWKDKVEVYRANDQASAFLNADTPDVLGIEAELPAAYWIAAERLRASKHYKYQCFMDRILWMHTLPLLRYGKTMRELYRFFSNEHPLSSSRMRCDWVDHFLGLRKEVFSPYMTPVIILVLNGLRPLLHELKVKLGARAGSRKRAKTLQRKVFLATLGGNRATT